jgi:DNA repair exonuclease SbcCD ATPase subunit
VDASAISSRLIGTLIVEKGLITEAQLEFALEEQRTTGARLGEILMSKFGVTRADLESALTAQRAENQSLGAEEDSEANAAVRELARMLDEWGRVEEAPKRPIGEIFVERGFITSGQLEDALDEQKLSGRKLGEILVSQGKLSRLRLWDALEDQAASFEVDPKSPSTDGMPGGMPGLRVASEALAEGASSHTPNPELWQPKREPSPAPAARPTDESAPAMGTDETVTGLRAEIAALKVRLDELPEGSDEWREAVCALGARIDELADGSAVSQSTLQRLSEQLEEERTADRGLDAQLDALAQRVDQLTAELTMRFEQVADSVTAAASREQADALRHDLDALRTAVDSVPAPTDDLEELSDRVGELAQNLTARLQHVTDGLAAAATRDQAERLRRELDDLRASLDALPAPTDDVDALTRRVEQLSESFAIRLQQVADSVGDAASKEQAEALRTELDDLRAALAELPGPTGAVDELADRVARIDEHLNARVQQLTDQLAAAVTRDEAQGLRDQLDRLHAAVAAFPVPSDDVDELSGRIAELEERLSARLQHVGESLAQAATREQAERLRRELDDVRAALDALPAPTDELETLARRVEHLSESFSARLEHLGQGAASREQAEALRGDLDSLRAAFESLTAGTDEWRHAVAALEVRLHELAEGSTEARSVVEQLSSRIDAGDDDERHRDERVDTLARLAGELTARLDELSHALAEAATREQTHQLHYELDDLRGRVDSIPAPSDEWREAIAALAVQIDSAQSSEEWRDAVAALAVRLDEVAAPSGEWHAEIDSLCSRLRERIDRLEREVSDAASNDGIETVSHQVDELRERLASDDARLDQLGRRLEELAPLHRVDELADTTAETASAHGAALDAVREELGAQARRAQEAAEKRRADKAAARERFDALEASLADTSAVSAAIEPLQARLIELEQRLSDLAATQSAERSAELDALRHELRDELRRGVAGAASTQDDALGAVREELAAQAQRVADAAADARRSDASALDHRLEQLESSLAEHTMDHDTDRHAELDAFRHQLRDELYRSVAGAASAHDEALDGVREELAAQAQRAADAAADARRADANALDQRLEQLESSLTEHTAGHDADRRAELDALRSDLVARVEQVAARTADRTELEALRQRLEQELTELLDRQGQEDAAAQVTGQAIRDGLAELGRRLTASEQAYFESGRSLRRSIEGLGLAITDADWHLGSGAAAAKPAGEESYVAFVPAGEGYRLVECDGPAPYLGQIVELDGFDDVMLRVSRLGRSPLPFDGRPCAYLERLSA